MLINKAQCVPVFSMLLRQAHRQAFDRAHAEVSVGTQHIAPWFFLRRVISLDSTLKGKSQGSKVKVILYTLADCN